MKKAFLVRQENLSVRVQSCCALNGNTPGEANIAKWPFVATARFFDLRRSTIDQIKAIDLVIKKH